MRDRPYGVLPRRIALMAVPMLAACALGTAQSGAATPHPVRAGSIKVVKRAVVQPAPIALNVIEGYLTPFAGRPVRISCDTPGVPSPLDGQLLADGLDGEVFPTMTLDADGVTTAIWQDVIHLSTQECSALQRVNRIREPNPTAWFEFDGHRIDETSGAAFEIALHEALHIGLRSLDEGVVECATYRNAWPLAHSLGLSTRTTSLVFQGMRARHFDYRPADPAEGVYRTVC